jgi:hypothetical protein
MTDDDLTMAFVILALCLLSWFATNFILQGGGEEVNVPLKLRTGIASKLLALPEFKFASITSLIAKAKMLTKCRVPCGDKATAIALILGVEGRTI